MLSFNLPGATGCRFHSRASGAAIMRQRESLIGVAWGARPKPGPASPANVSKRGLSARLYVPNQTLILVNARLPKEILTAGNQGRPGGYGGWNRVPSWVLASPLPEVRALARLEGRRPFCGRFILRGSLRSRLQRQRRSRCAGMTEIQFRILAARCARAVPELPCPPNERAQGRPGARCTRGPVCGLH
jgi:hypothetical protein